MHTDVQLLQKGFQLQLFPQITSPSLNDKQSSREENQKETVTEINMVHNLKSKLPLHTAKTSAVVQMCRFTFK